MSINKTYRVFQYLQFTLGLKKILIYLGLLLSGGYTLGFLVYDQLFYIMFVRHPKRIDFSAHISLYRQILGETGRKYSQQYQLALNWLLQQPTELWVLITADDQLEMHAQFLRNTSSQKNVVVILAHGFRGNPLQMAHFAQFYNLSGYHVLMPATRAHASSQGERISFGFREQQDLTCWMKKVIDELGPDTKVVLHGISMGGATVLLTAAQNQMPQLKSVIADSSFSSLYDAFSYQFPVGLRHFGSYLLKQADWKLRQEESFSFEDLELTKKIPAICVPTLLIHGENDKIVPPEMLQSLHNACTHPRKLQLLIPRAGHGGAWFADPISYQTILQWFLESSLEDG